MPLLEWAVPRNISMAGTCSLCFSFYSRKHHRNPRPPHPLSPQLAAGHFQSISHHLELIVLFLYLCKKQFHWFCVDITSGREAFCLPPAQCPSQTGQCTASRCPRHSGAAGPGRPGEARRALGRWGHGPWQTLRQSAAHRSSGSSACSRWKPGCWKKKVSGQVT